MKFTLKAPLGSFLQDKVTGFQGTLVSVGRYITGCDRYELLPKAESPSKYPESQIFDVDRLDYVDGHFLQPTDEELKVETAFELGVQVTDKITGLKGILTGFARHLTGCDTYLLTPKAKEDHKASEPKWFDDNRLELVIPEEPKKEIDTSRSRGAMESWPKY